MAHPLLHQWYRYRRRKFGQLETNLWSLAESNENHSSWEMNYNTQLYITEVVPKMRMYIPVSLDLTQQVQPRSSS